MSRHDSGEEPPDKPAQQDAWLSVSGHKPRRRRVVLADSRGRGRVLRTIIELEEQTSVGEKLVRDLVMIQLRTAFLLSALFVLVIGGLPIAFYLMPALADVVVVGVRLPWLLLGVVPFPLLYGLGYWYRWLAERHERDFVNMVDR
ncbi:hypothetical protein F0L68_09310 [Solihabitans fulvus]|uniref:DUF485 domain-containing protein n=1 Tax=Solihabitans fulvus TaxID=1892852 RepID=A0A5B2XLN3_9PSEU|nr:hypothetical protein [Solihabitans fulvus]KAA2263682.1 hypothetical protein F0L68_09310 [Solihabitans fulvus]